MFTLCERSDTMKIVLAPSKTMQKTKKHDYQTAPLFLEKQTTVLAFLKKKSVKELMEYFEVSEKIAQENYDRFQSYDPTNTALFTYTGQQFKHLDVNTLDDASIDYLFGHLLVMSAMYGLVRGKDKIGLYRLPMALKIEEDPLVSFWKDTISTYLEGETVINLASKEYFDAIDRSRVHLIDIDFLEKKNGKYRKYAMQVKKMRGLMTRFMALNQVTDIKTLKTFNEEGYQYIDAKSTPTTLTFIKE